MGLCLLPTPAHKRECFTPFVPTENSRALVLLRATSKRRYALNVRGPAHLGAVSFLRCTSPIAYAILGRSAPREGLSREGRGG